MTKHYNRVGFETKDDAPDMNAIMREVKAFGDDVKGLKTSMQKDLKDVRDLAEGAKAASPELEAKFTEITTSIEAKNAAIEAFEKKTADQFAELETAMNRMPTGLSNDEAADYTKAAIDFYATKAATSGSLSFKNRPNAENIDMDGYKAWDEVFGKYLRIDDRPMTSADEQKALSVGSNPNGGYLVPTARSNRIIEAIRESSPMRQLATVETIGTEALEIPLDLDEVGVEWVGEEQTSTEGSTPQVGIMRIPVHEMAARPRVTQRFLEDAAIDVEDWLERKVSEKFGRGEATPFITGNGINKPRGILSYATGSASARGTILSMISGGATTITADAVVSLPYQLKSQYMARGSWLMKRSTVLAVMLLKDGHNQYMWRPGLTEGARSSLVGHSLNLADDMPALAASSLSVAFGDWRSAYTIVDRLGISVQRDPFTVKPFVEFYTRKRVGGDVTDFDAYALMKTAAS